MKITKIAKADLVASEWDGGKTYEYFIYPPQAKYAERDFLFRISSASIDKVPSQFSRFENYKRYLVMLDNSLEIIRNGSTERYEKHELFTFDSYETITSSSVGNDFNLMIHSTKCAAKLTILTHKTIKSSDFLVLVALKKQYILINNIKYSLEVSDVVRIENISNSPCEIDNDEKIIICEINLLV